MNLLRLLLLIIFSASVTTTSRAGRALQRDHEKPQDEKWMEAFFGRNLQFDQVPSLVNLIVTITNNYLKNCKPIILYDEMVEKSDGLLLQTMFRSLPIAYVHGQITNNYRIKQKSVIINQENTCITYIMFMADVMRCKDVIGEQPTNRVIIVARSSQWRVYEFLGSEVARVFVNLIVIAQSEKVVAVGNELPFILYTHKMYVDGLGSSTPVVLTSWKDNNFSRSGVELFPVKMIDGFAGHRFIVSVAHQPPYAIKRNLDENDDIVWDGSEVRLARLLAEIYNFTTDFREAKDINTLGSGDAVTKELAGKKANLGIGGIYVTPERIEMVDVSKSHSQDCAAFISISSTAIPRYRAIMGPFHWSVWLSLTAVYLFAIFPLALSDKHTLRHLLEKPEEMENMFWYVFGTFTNCFTFTGEASWGHSEKVTTRVLVGFYWVFTIITTACYTGSIIAFVTLPILPQTINTPEEMISGRFQVGTLNKGGWNNWFSNSTDPSVKRLFRNIEYLNNIQAGLKNVTKAFFWPYAFLGSRDELDYVIRTNFTTQSKRTILHVSDQCFVPFGVSVLYPFNAIYKDTINRGILQAVQSGFMIKIMHDVEWETMRTATGKFLSANAATSTTKLRVEDRALTLDDTQGMFLLLGAGFLLGAASLLSEWLGGCLNFCKQRVGRRASHVSIESNPRSHDTPTPRDKLNSLPYSINLRDIHTGNNSIPENNHVQKNLVDFILHANADEAKSLGSFDTSSTDYDEEIDRIFKLDSVFGESNDEDEEAAKEEIASCNFKDEDEIDEQSNQIEETNKLKDTDHLEEKEE